MKEQLNAEQLSAAVARDRAISRAYLGLTGGTVAVRAVTQQPPAEAAPHPSSPVPEGAA